MILVIVGFLISLYLFYDTCNLHSKAMVNDKAHYDKQYDFYTVNYDELNEAKTELKRLEDVYSATLTKYNTRLEKINTEMLNEVNSYEINLNEDFQREVNKIINEIDIEELKHIVIGGTKCTED